MTHIKTAKKAAVIVASLLTFLTVFSAGAGAWAKTVSEKPARAGYTIVKNDWDPMENYYEPDLTISDTEGLRTLVYTAVITYNTIPDVKAYDAKELLREDIRMHTAMLKKGTVNYTWSGYGKGAPDNLKIKFNYDEAGSLIRNTLYGAAIPKTSAATWFSKSVDSILKSLLKNDMSDFEKAEAIHDYIVLRGTYDLSENPPDISYTAYGMLKNKTSVCEGYAELFAAMGIRAGLHVYCITGEMGGVNHMWNLLELDGEWYHVDCTSDDPVPDKKKVRYDYFLCSDDYMQEEAFAWDTDMFVAATSTLYDDVA